MFNRAFRLGRAVPAFSAAAFVVALAAPSSLAWAQGAQTAQPPAKPAPAAQAPADTKDLPDGRTVVDRHIEAVGGRKAVLGHKSSHATGTMTMPANGISGSIEVFAAAPNKVLVKSRFEGIGEVLEGFDGTVGWSINPMTGPVIATGKELEQKKLDSDFHGDVYDEKRYTSVKTLERTTFEGRPAYKVSLTRRDGVEDIEFFDVETGLRAGKIVTRESMMGPLTLTQVMSDYKKFGDLLQPTKMTQTAMGVQQIITLSSIEYDKVDPSVFELPAQIKALIK
jgi:hypothetical protein